MDTTTPTTGEIVEYQIQDLPPRHNEWVTKSATFVREARSGWEGDTFCLTIPSGVAIAPGESVAWVERGYVGGETEGDPYQRPGPLRAWVMTVRNQEGDRLLGRGATSVRPLWLAAG